MMKKNIFRVSFLVSALIMPSCVTPVTNTNVQSSASPQTPGASSSESFAIGNPLETSNPRPSSSVNPSINNPSGSGSFNGVEFPNAATGTSSNGTTTSSDLVLTIGNPLATPIPGVSPNLTPQVSSTNNLRLSYYDYFSAELKWQPIAGAESYRLYQDGKVIVDNLTNFIYYVKNLRPNTNYTFDLLGVNNGVESNKSTIKMRTYIPSSNTSNNYNTPVYYPTPSPTPSPDLSNVIFVKQSTDDNGDNNGDGKSWATAYKDLQTVLALPNLNGKQIWVAKGTYYPVLVVQPSPVESGGEDPRRNESFVIPAGVKIYGGFAGTETNINSRNISANPTIISGDFEQDDSDVPFINDEDQVSERRQNNSNNVVKISDDNGIPATLDSLTITGGYGGDIYSDGGGINIRNAWPIINNVTFRENYSSTGGAISISSNEAENVKRVIISNSKFIDNRARFSGGAIVYNLSTFSLAYSTFTNNYAEYGGNSIAKCHPEGLEYENLDGNNISPNDTNEVVSSCGGV